MQIRVRLLGIDICSSIVSHDSGGKPALCAHFLRVTIARLKPTKAEPLGLPLT